MAQWPSAELKPYGARRARVMSVVWWLLFALALAATVGGAWRGIEQHRKPTGFDRVGVSVSYLGTCITVVPVTRAARQVWPKAIDQDGGACLLAVNGRAVGPAMPRDTVAGLLDGPVDTSVPVMLAEIGGTPQPVQFRRADVGWFETAKLIAYTLVALLYGAVAFLLRRRRPTDRIFMRMSFIFLLMVHAAGGAFLFWAWVADWVIGLLLAFVGITLLMTTLPAFPSGVYVPRAARWLRLIVPLAVVGSVVIASSQSPDADTDWFEQAMLAMIGVGVGLLMLRFHRMPRGLEKQQIKWAVFGLTVGLLMLLSTDIFPQPSGLTAVFELVTIFGLALMPAGVGVSLLEYRLNDADAAAGKSVGYAIVTVVVGVVWALVQSVVSDIAKTWAGSPAATTAITTVIAALVFTPARSYVLAWTEKKFQPALVRLRKLPEKLDRWQTCQTPDELAAATLADLVNGVGAAYAAILGDDGREWRVLAAHGIEPELAMAQLSAERPADRRQDPFPIRRELTDQLGQPDILAIGPRSDGASFTHDEKAAIALILEPLSNALQAAALRERHIVKVENSLTGIDQRLGRLEVKLEPLADEAASRRSPKGS